MVLGDTNSRLTREGGEFIMIFDNSVLTEGAAWVAAVWTLVQEIRDWWRKKRQ